MTQKIQAPLLLIIVFFLFTLTACSPKMSVFTKSLYEENGWSDNDLRHIQFYLSDDIILRRSLSKGETQISSGKIKMINGQRVEEIIFERGTPGVFIKRKKSNHFAVAFEDGPDTRYLVFGPNNSHAGDYSLLAIEWKGRRGVVKYDNKKWKTYNRGGVSKLLVDLKKTNQISVQKRKVGGRKVNN